MASAPFAFGFSGDDIDTEHDVGDIDEDETQLYVSGDEQTKREQELRPPQKHTLKDILSTLPSSISYNNLFVPILIPLRSPTRPYPHQHQRQHPQTTHLPIPRRSLFDLLTQLKAETDIPLPTSASGSVPTHADPTAHPNPLTGTSGTGRATTDDHDLLANLDRGTDLASGVYEGGFKTWECGVDLAGWLAGQLDLELGPASGAGEGEGTGEAGFLRGFLFGGEGGGGGGDAGEEGEEELDIVELGAGSGIPSLVLLNYILKLQRDHLTPSEGGSAVEDGTVKRGKSRGFRRRRGEGGIARGTRTHFTLCDYNPQVLHLLTGANTLLQVLRGPFATTTTPAFSSQPSHPHHNDHNEQHHHPHPPNQETDLDLDLDLDPHPHPLTPTTQTTAQTTLSSARVTIDFISGDWSAKPFLDLVLTQTQPQPHDRRRHRLLVLASETLYSPHTLRSFAETLISLLRGRYRREWCGDGEEEYDEDDEDDNVSAVALVAAKKVYFGVGGGVDEFVREVEGRGARVVVVWDSDVVGDGGGVGRVIMMVTV